VESRGEETRRLGHGGGREDERIGAEQRAKGREEENLKDKSRKRKKKSNKKILKQHKQWHNKRKEREKEKNRWKWSKWKDMRGERLGNAMWGGEGKE